MDLFIVYVFLLNIFLLRQLHEAEKARALLCPPYRTYSDAHLLMVEHGPVQPKLPIAVLGVVLK